MFDGSTNTNNYGSLVVTHECNRKCPFCIDRYRGNCEYMSIPTVIKSLAVAKKYGLRDILVIGGEPTLHPNIIEICKEVKKFGFNLILTTNYDYPLTVWALDGIVDSFNISFYNQKTLPIQNNFNSDLTLTTLIHKKQLNTKEKLDEFIDSHKNNMTLKFSTLDACSEWTRQNQNVEYLDSLDCEKMILFNEIEGLKYRGCIIKRYDRVVNKDSHQSLKFHVDGEISRSWQRN